MRLLGSFYSTAYELKPDLPSPREVICRVVQKFRTC